MAHFGACIYAQPRINNRIMDWRFSTFILVLFALLIVFSVAPIEDVMCNNCYVKGVLEEAGKDGALNCFEFWFNRYQTLFGVLVALAAGLLAWLGARGQVAAANQQRAVSLISIVNDRREAVQQIVQAIKGIDRLNSQMLRSMVSFNQAIRDMRQDGLDILAKQEIYERDFEPGAANYAQFSEAFSNRIVTARENLKAAILPPSVRDEVEDYLTLARRVDRQCKVVAADIKDLIAADDWKEKNKYIFRLMLRSKEKMHHIDFDDHGAKKTIEKKFTELSSVLEVVLSDAHKS